MNGNPRVSGGNLHPWHGTASGTRPGSKNRQCMSPLPLHLQSTLKQRPSLPLHIHTAYRGLCGWNLWLLFSGSDEEKRRFQTASAPASRCWRYVYSQVFSGTYCLLCDNVSHQTVKRSCRVSHQRPRSSRFGVRSSLQWPVQGHRNTAGETHGQVAVAPRCAASALAWKHLPQLCLVLVSPSFLPVWVLLDCVYFVKTSRSERTWRHP